MKPSKLVHCAGWLAVLLMLAISSPGVRVEPSPQAPPLAQVDSLP